MSFTGTHPSPGQLLCHKGEGKPATLFAQEIISKLQDLIAYL